MPYTDLNTLHNPAFGASPPASWGDATRDNFSWVAGDAASGNSKPMCRVRRSTFQTIASGAPGSPILFNLERYDPGGGMHSNTTNTSRIVAPVAGVYAFGACVAFAPNATGVREIAIRLNGGTTIAAASFPASASADTFLHISTDYQLAAGDYVEVLVSQTSGGNLDTRAYGNFSAEAWARWVGVG